MLKKAVELINSPVDWMWATLKPIQVQRILTDLKEAFDNSDHYMVDCIVSTPETIAVCHSFADELIKIIVRYYYYSSIMQP